MIIFKIIFRWTSSPNTWFVIDPNWFPIPKNVLRTSTSKWLRPKMLIIVINAPLSPLSNLDISNVLDPTARKCGPGKKSILILSLHRKFWNFFFPFNFSALHNLFQDFRNQIHCMWIQRKNGSPIHYQPRRIERSTLR